MNPKDPTLPHKKFFISSENKSVYRKTIITSLSDTIKASVPQKSNNKKPFSSLQNIYFCTLKASSHNYDLNNYTTSLFGSNFQPRPHLLGTSASPNGLGFRLLNFFRQKFITVGVFITGALNCLASCLVKISDW
jgi:hypothetical protein